MALMNSDLGSEFPAAELSRSPSNTFVIDVCECSELIPAIAGIMAELIISPRFWDFEFLRTNRARKSVIIF